MELAEGVVRGAAGIARPGVDLVVSNPPYVAESEYTELDPTIRCWEPRTALVADPEVGGTAGMADVEAIVGAARGGCDRAALRGRDRPAPGRRRRCRGRAAGFASVGIERDLTGRPRMLVAGC